MWAFSYERGTPVHESLEKEACAQCNMVKGQRPGSHEWAQCGSVARLFITLFIQTCWVFHTKPLCWFFVDNDTFQLFVLWKPVPRKIWFKNQQL